jgi:hypothetical protein
MVFDEIVDGDAGNLVLARSDALPPIGIFNLCQAIFLI